MRLDAAQDGFRYALLFEGRNEAACAARAEGELLHRRKPRDGPGDLRHGRAEPLAILLGREDGNLEHGSPFE